MTDMGLDVPYSIELCRQLSPLGLKWMEEYLVPDDYEGHTKVSAAVADLPTLMATGEHEYTRYGFKSLIECGVDILQPDVTWCGGITEARRIVALAAANDLHVIPHGSSVFSYHLVMASNNCPMAEFSMTATSVFHEAVAWWGPEAGNLFVGEPVPVNGSVTLSNAPGFGVELIRDRLVRPFVRAPELSLANARANIEFQPPQRARMRL